MTKSFTGKVALVTGASSGIGRATALAFAREGAKVVVSDVVVDGGNETVQLIKQAGGEATFVKADVAQTADVESLVQQTVTTYGRLDCAHNNAGISGPLTTVADTAESKWDRVIAINLKGVWLCMKHEIQAMLANGGGAIVNIASIYGLKPADSGHVPYGASKHGVVGLTTGAAVDYGQMSIRINAVAPGFTHSEMVDVNRPRAAESYRKLVARHSGMNRLGNADEAANAIVWLCSDEASYVNGSVLTVDGGSATRMY